MKRKLPIILVLSLMLMITGCTRLPQSSGAITTPVESVSAVSEQGGRISVVSTLFPPYDFVRQIAGDFAEVTLLLPAGSESHTYEPTPQDILRIQNCDVFLYIGGESETWIKEVLDSMDTSDMRVIRLMDCVENLTEELVEGMEAHEEEHAGEPGAADEPAYDEHIWTSPTNAVLMSNAIAAALEGADPAHADAYRANADAYAVQLQDLDATFRQIAATAKRHTLVFGDRFPFRYFMDAYGFSYYAAFPGCAEEAEPSAATVAFLIDRVRAEEIPVVFYIELSNERMADTICEATGAKKLLLHSCHNVSKTDFENGATYISLMLQNAENLKEAVD